MIASRKQVPALVLALALVSALGAAAQPTFTKVFNPDTIGPGSISTLTFTIDNFGGGTVDMMNFTDVLPVGVTIASPAVPVNGCDGNLVLTGGNTIELQDGMVVPGAFCTLSVNVTSAVVGTHMNLSGDLTSSAGNSGPATDDLNVVTTLPGFTKSFSPSSLPLGSRAGLTFTIDNSLNASRVGNLEFTDNLPTGLVVASPSNAFTDCVSAGFPDTTITAVPGSSVIDLDANGNAIVPGFEVLPAGGTCTVSVDVVATGAGALNNVTSDLLADFVSAGKAGAVLTSTAAELVLIKEFTDDPVPPGGQVALEFTILNRTRDFTATGVTFSDNLGDAGGALAGLAVTGPLPMNPCGAGSTLSGTTTLTLTGGTIPPEGSCTFSVTLQVPPGATPGIYPNTTSAVIGTVGELVIGNMATDNLFVFAAPILTKTFLDDPVVAGGSTRMEFTITNTSTTSMATDIAFLDELTTFLPFPISAVLPAPGFCNGTGTMGFFFPDIDRQGISMTGGTLAAGASCTFEVTLNLPVGLAAGLYTNVTDLVTATVGPDMVIGNSATATFQVVGGPQLAKEFTDDPVQPGAMATLQFTLTHDSNALTDATGINFTDDLNAALTGLAAVGLPLNDICGAGSSISGTTNLSFTGGTLAPGASCQFDVTVQVPPGATPGFYTNTTSTVSATVSGLATTNPAASDTLAVSGLTFMKEFTDDPVIPGGQATLQFTIANAAGAPAATGLSFSDNLATEMGAGFTFDPGSLPVTPCGAGSSTILLPGNTFFSLGGGNLLAGEMCQFSVTVDVGAAVASGIYNNRTSVLSGGPGGNVPPAEADLIVAGDLLEITKTFLTNPVAPGAMVDLEFTITNLSLAGAATGITFTDDLDAALSGLVAVGLPVNDVCGAGSQIAGAGLLTLTGGNLAPGGSCTFSVTVQVPAMPAAPSADNITSTVMGTIGGLGVTGLPATDTLLIQNVDFSKSFDGPTVESGTVVLSFTIDNLGGAPVSGLGFLDDLDAVLPGLVATGLPLVDICGLGSMLDGTGLLTFSGGSLGGGESCNFDVTLQVPTAATAGDYLNTTTDLQASGLPVAVPATATLMVEPPPTFAKAFAPDTIPAGGVSTLTFTIDNGASVLAASSLDFSDTLPTNVVLASPSNASTTCTGGTITAVAGTGTVSYTGGSVAAGLSCTVQVDVTSAVAGTYDNTSGDLTSSSGNSGTATDNLTVEPLPVFTKAFAPDTVPSGAVSALTFTIDNSGSSLAAGNLDFTDNLPPSVVVATPANASTTCTGGTLTAVAASAVITYNGGGSVGATATCTVTVDVLAVASGVHVNTSGDLTSSVGNSGPAMATLTVDPPPLFTKAFSPNIVGLDEATTLTFTIDNTANVLDATGLAFTDNLPAGMEVADPANTFTDCGAGMVTAAPGDTTVSFSGGSVAAGMTCTVSVDVFSTILGDSVNVTEVLSSSLGDSAPATNTLTVSGSVTEIPTLSEWALLLFVLGLGLLGAWRLRQ